MPKVTTNQTAFNTGEIAPRAVGRIDIENRFSALKTCENFLLTPFGSIERVPGTYFAASAKYANKRCRLINFIYSKDDAYIIEMGDLYLRFFKSQGQLTLSSATAWNTSTVYVVGNFVTESAKIYYCIEAHTSGTFATDLAAGKWVEQSIYEVPSPYLEAELRDVDYVTTADIGYFAHENYDLYKISRFGDTNWTFSAVSYTYPPFYPTNTTAQTMTPSATSGSITITSSTSYFTAAAVGSYVQMVHSSTTGYAKITAYTNATTVTATVVANFGATSATSNWNISVGDFAGNPESLVFQDQRLFLISKTTIWGSKTGIYEDFQLGSAASDGIRITIASNNVNNGTWLDSSRELIVGTIGGVFSIDEVSDATKIPSVRRQNEYGSAKIQPKHISNYSYYATKNRKKIREIVYNFDKDGYLSNDVTMLSEHILGSGVVEIAYQQEPYNILWCLRGDGQIACMTREPEQNVLGWSRVLEDTRTDDIFESVTVIPSTNEDECWFAIQRDINGSTVRYIEYSMPINFSEKKECFFLRSGLTYDGTSTDTITGLDHLEGETVYIFADGCVQPSKVVSSGSITLTNAATYVHVGLLYKSKAVTLDPEAGASAGTAQTKMKRVSKAAIRFYNTISGKFGKEGTELDTIPFRNTEDALGTSPELYTGYKDLPVRGGWEKEWNLEIRQDLQLPMTITNVILTLTTNEG